MQGTKRKKTDSLMLTVRISPELSDAIAAEVKVRAAARPGERVTEADVVRSILHASLLGGGK